MASVSSMKNLFQGTKMDTIVEKPVKEERSMRNILND
jgi:hypothetical protein